VDSAANQLAFRVFQQVQNKSSRRRFTEKTRRMSIEYEWPLPTKNPSVEEQILSPLAANKDKVRVTEMNLNAVLEATKQIRSAVR